MLELNWSKKYKKDLKMCIKRNYDISLLENVINTLRIPLPLPKNNHEHELKGEYIGNKECHITPDWLLIYRIQDNELYLLRTGTHADLFDM